MKRLALLLAFFVSAFAYGGPFAVQGSGGQLFVGSTTYASLTSAAPCSSSLNGYEGFVTDWGANGAKVRCNGTRWLPIGGRVLLKHSGAAVTGITNTATVVVQSNSLPAGALQANDSIVVDFTGISKNGTTDAGNLLVYLGSACTTSDTALVVANNQLLGSTTLNAAAQYVFKVVSNTSVQRVGPAAGGGEYAQNSTAAIPTAVTVSDLSATSVCVSAGLQSAGTTNTLSLQDGAIWQIVN